MARLKSNVLVEGFSGRVDRLLFKQYKYGTVVSKMPDRSKVRLTANQKKANKRFQQAVQYAKSVLADTTLHKQYAKAVKNGKSLYHAALSDFLKQNGTQK
jgi:hypothetical protein